MLPQLSKLTWAISDPDASVIQHNKKGDDSRGFTKSVAPKLSLATRISPHVAAGSQSRKMSDQCCVCRNSFSEDLLAEAHSYPFWDRDDGACPACVQENLLRTLLARGDAALHEAIQMAWPLDAEAAFGALPTRLRLHADPRFAGRGVTIALVDSGFYPHPDLVKPRNRIRLWADATRDPVSVVDFGREETPDWPGWNEAHDWQWHGTMTSVVAAGNGFLSHGLYSGLAHSADLVLIQARDSEGHISSTSIQRALAWILAHAAEFGIRVVSLSVSGDQVWPLAGNAVDEAVMELIGAGISVVAAAGNDGQRRLLPPATAPLAVTVGGIDDKNLFTHDELSLWHSNYGSASNEVPKPELVAPSIWVAGPVLPNTAVAREAEDLFRRRAQTDADADRRIAQLKLITPHYQHVEGTSFAAPIVASAIACMLDANPTLTPSLIRDVLMQTAHSVPGADRERQGAGALNAGLAVARALAEHHGQEPGQQLCPSFSAEGITFSLHDHDASSVQILGSWNNWRAPGIVALRVEPGFWRTSPARFPEGQYSYKFLLNGERWLDDPANPRKKPDGMGGLNCIFVA
jgi:serine protease AprX